eukprot:Em0011g731a
MTEGVMLFFGVFTYFSSVACYLIAVGLSWGYFVGVERNGLAYAAAILITILCIMALSMTLLACGLRKRKEGRYSFGVTLAVTIASTLIGIVAIILIIVSLTNYPHNHEAHGAFAIIFVFAAVLLNIICLALTYIAGASYRE